MCFFVVNEIRLNISSAKKKIKLQEKEEEAHHFHYRLGYPKIIDLLVYR